MSNFACLKKQGPGCIWDWPYPLTKVLSEIRIHTFQSDSSRHKASNVSFYHINCGVLCKDFQLREKP